MNTKRIGRRAGVRGFTLIEMLLVLVIIGLIGGLVVTNLVGKAEGANIKAASGQIQRLSMEVENYYLDTGSLPEELDDLVNDPGTAGWNGPYTQSSKLKDPWGEPYVYRYPGQHGTFDLFSKGPDRNEGGQDNNADITNWE